jgi:phenylpropionate dioxygenase-like ring-hydroxylating dioxygenase large terminal subunit
MLTPQDNERLTRVAPGTPMGDVFRRYWIPAALSSELPDADGPPVRVRLLGEDLVAFRDSAGEVGMVGAYCPHRRAPMFFGRNEECGLRCVYHGWKFDRSGACVDMPSEPPDSLFKTKVSIESYPAWEGGGIVWTYMGPPERRPAPPDYELVRAPATHRFVSKTHQACNYLQALEGAVDPTHATILHNNDIGDRAWLDDFHSTVADIELEKTDYGYTYAGNRVRDGQRWIRIYHYIMPSLQMRGTVEGYFSTKGHAPTIDGHIWAPIDDHNVYVYNWMYSYDPSGPIPEAQALAQEIRLGRGPDDFIPGTFMLKRNAANDYLIDRTAQKHQTFTGIKGVNTQDVALQEQMGAIVDRSKEHLGASDRAIIVMRQLLMEATFAVESGATPRGADPQTYRNVRAVDRKIPLDADWKDAVKADLYARF